MSPTFTCSFSKHDCESDDTYLQAENRDLKAGSVSTSTPEQDLHEQDQCVLASSAHQLPFQAASQKD